MNLVVANIVVLCCVDVKALLVFDKVDSNEIMYVLSQLGKIPMT